MKSTTTSTDRSIEIAVLTDQVKELTALLDEKEQDIDGLHRQNQKLAEDMHAMDFERSMLLRQLEEQQQQQQALQLLLSASPKEEVSVLQATSSSPASSPLALHEPAHTVLEENCLSTASLSPSSTSPEVTPPFPPGVSSNKKKKNKGGENNTNNKSKVTSSSISFTSSTSSNSNVNNISVNDATATMNGSPIGISRKSFAPPQLHFNSSPLMQKYQQQYQHQILRMNTSIDANGNVSFTEQDKHQHERSVLKVYMDNQLDLNESEMEFYEEVVNTLAEQHELLRAEKDALQIRADQDADAAAEQKNELQRMLRELEQEQSSNQQQISELNDAIKLLTSAISEKEQRIHEMDVDMENMRIQMRSVGVTKLSPPRERLSDVVVETGSATAAAAAIFASPPRTVTTTTTISSSTVSHHQHHHLITHSGASSAFVAPSLLSSPLSTRSRTGSNASAVVKTVSNNSTPHLPEHKLTNDFLGISSAADSDGDDDGHQDVNNSGGGSDDINKQSNRLVNGSFHSTEGDHIHDMDEIKRILAEREHQVSVCEYIHSNNNCL